MEEHVTNTQVREQTLKNGNPINRERQFGQPNGNKRGQGFWKKEDTPRYKLEQILAMNENEILNLISDDTKPLFDRKIAKSLLNEDAFKGLELMINQVYGPPKQRTELSTNNDNRCNIIISVKNYKKQKEGY